MELIVPNIYESTTGNLHQRVLDGAKRTIKQVNKHRSSRNKLVYITNTFNTTPFNPFDEDEDENQQIQQQAALPQEESDAALLQNQAGASLPREQDDAALPQNQSGNKPKKAEPCYLSLRPPNVRANRITKFSFRCVRCQHAICPDHRITFLYCSKCPTVQPQNQ